MILMIATTLSLLYHHANGFYTSSLPSHYYLLEGLHAAQNHKHNDVGSILFLHLGNDIVMENDEDLFRSIQGAGVPRATLEPEEIPSLLMTALQNNDFPKADAGLNAAWEFSSDITKNIFQCNRTEFIESAKETAGEFPTSFYGAAMTGQSWRVMTNLNRVGGPDGWIATQVMETVSSDGRVRRWQWELRKNRRPPCLGCWKVESIGSSDRKGNFEPE